MITFESSGFPAFYGNPVYDKSYENIEFLEKLNGVHNFPTPLFVGPFQTEATAQSFVSKIPSILRTQIAEDRRENLIDVRDGYAFRLSPENFGFYNVEVVRVLSDRVTGSFASLPPEDFLIRPGIGVGRILLGNSRSKVLAVLGKPRYSGDDYDSWESGDEYLKVVYRKGAVSQIIVSSSKFHTATGLTTVASSQAFLKAFPTKVKYCCYAQGASASWDWTCWDAITEGIAMCNGFDKGFIIHQINKAYSSPSCEMRREQDVGEKISAPCSYDETYPPG